MKHFTDIFRRTGAALTGAAIIVTVLAAGFGMAMQSRVVLADDEDQTGGGTEVMVDPTISSEGYSAVLYDNQNGLPTSEANAIVQTEEGFIWIGSYSGLIRYDGNTFENMSINAGISSVVSLYVDSQNRLWIGTNDSGISVMEDGQFRTFNRNDGLKSLSIRSICEDQAGNIIAGTTEGVIWIDQDMVVHTLEAKEIAEKYVRQLKVGAEDTIYGTTLDGCVFQIKDTELIGFYDESKLSGITGARSVTPDPERPGFAYIGDSGNTIYYGKFQDGGFSRSQRYYTDDYNYINSMNYQDGMLWVCTDNGVGYFADVRNDTTFIKIEPIPMTTSIEDMLYDYSGNVWYVSSQQGVMKIVPNQFTDIFNKYKLPEGVVYTTCVYNDELYIGTKNDGLIVISGGKVQNNVPVSKIVTLGGAESGSKNLITLLEDCKIRSIIEDSQGRLWLSTFSDYGLLVYDGSTLTSITESDGLPSNRVRTVHECSDGTMIVCCTGGLAVLDDDFSVAKVYDGGDGFTNTEILTADQMDNGDIVVGTDGGGIFVITAGGVKSLNVDNAGLTSDVVMRVKKDTSRDIMWIVTSNSIEYLDADYNVTNVSNFPYLNNFDIYQNTKDELWVLSSNGIYVVKASDMLSGEEFSYEYYGIYNGLPGISTSNSYSELTDDGYLFMAGTTTVTKVNIEASFENVSELKAAVPFIEADGVFIYPDDDGNFTIPASTQKLTIYSYVFNYALINPNVSYQLKGFDSQAVTVARSDLKPVDYTNLAGGKYYFEMGIVDPQTGETKTVMVQITKQKHVYEELWFMCAMLLLFAWIVYAVVKNIIDKRTAKLKAKNREQKKLIREITEAFAKVIDMKDKYTRGHSVRVAYYTSLLAREMGCSDDDVEKYYNIALMHDVGKIGIPMEVLNKPGKLDDNEYETIKSHAALGYDTLKDISIMPELSIGAGMHHERPDGKGYPNGLHGEEIPLVARIIGVADTFDAMYSNRPYRNRMPFEKVVGIIKEVSGTQLDPEVVNAFLSLVDKGVLKDVDDKTAGALGDEGLPDENS
ncbi:MAG: HD domain-containing protein [Clostridiales bacterium]|nr:HD domain-containing protein [Clostridiales bacterium]